jgi:putative membrane protein
MFTWHMGSEWFFGGILIWALFWIAVIVAVVVLVIRWLNNPARHTGSGAPPAESAEDLLKRRFAAGEIDEEEFRRRLEVLRTP